MYAHTHTKAQTIRYTCPQACSHTVYAQACTCVFPPHIRKCMQTRIRIYTCMAFTQHAMHVHTLKHAYRHMHIEILIFSALLTLTCFSSFITSRDLTSSCYTQV